MKKIAVIVIFMFFLAETAYAYDIPNIDGYNMFSKTAESVALGEFTPNPVNILNNVISSVAYEVKNFAKPASAILIMALLSSTVKTLNFAVGGRTSADAAFFVFFCVMSGLALECFYEAVGYGNEVIGNMTDFMGKFTPVIILSLFACCKTVSAAAFEPVLSAAVIVVSQIIKCCLLPTVTFSAVLAVAGNISEKNGISGFIKIVKSVSKWMLTFIITLFTGVNAAYGFASPTLDAVGAKTLKFAVGSLVPVVGDFLSDSLETVAASGAVMKNTVGVAGMVMICFICVSPLIKLAVMQFLFKLTAAVTEPVTDGRISAMLWDMSEAISAVFGICALCAVMFIINICIILRFTA